MSDQVAEQLRYQIASGTYKVNDVVPPTRKLGAQLGVSFHTIRKAYQKLVREGILQVLQGSGYKVLPPTPLTKEDGLERGASIVQEALHKLVGLGLGDSEIEYIFQEQLTAMDSTQENLKVVFVAPYMEMAENCATYISSSLQLQVEYATLNTIEAHQDGDYFLCKHRDIQVLSERMPRIDILGISAYLTPQTLDRIAHLFPQETLGILAYHKETVPQLMAEIQAETNFSGQIFGASLDEGTSHLSQFMDQTNLVVYTRKCKRRILSLSKQEKTFMMISHLVSPPSLESIQNTIPTRY